MNFGVVCGDDNLPCRGGLLPGRPAARRARRRNLAKSRVGGRCRADLKIALADIRRRHDGHREACSGNEALGVLGHFACREERGGRRRSSRAAARSCERGTGPYKPGIEGKVRVTLTTKGEFHINDKFPYRFKTGAPAEGASYPRAVLQRDDGKFEPQRATFEVPFVAARSGKFEVGGIFHLSACSATSCLVEKAPLTVSVDVR